MKSRQRFYSSVGGVSPDSEHLILQKAIELSNSISNVSRIVFTSYTKKNTGWIERLFGRNNVKKIIKGVAIKDSPVEIIFESLNTYDSQENEIVVCLGIESDEILKIEDNYDIVAIIVLPWIEDRITKWVRITNAVELQTNKPAESFELPPCVVRQALKDLTHSVNMSTGISHPSDESECKTYLRALNHYGYELNEDKIESFLFKELDWRKDNLEDILDIIKKINQGKSFQGGEKIGHENYIKRWKQNCEQ